MQHRYFIQLSYSGTNYNGWQVQENTPDTVQQILTDKLSELLGEKLEIVGCGRTDTGVHAKEFYAHFDSVKNDLHIDPRVWLYKMNAVLPFDIAIQKIIPVMADASARYSANARTYKYIINRKKDPFLISKAYYLFGDMNVKAMNEAASLLLKYSDFSSFSKSKTQVKNNECVIKQTEWREENDLLVFTITANRFLRNMVRAVVGTLLEVGRNKIDLKEFKNIVEGKNRSDAGLSVPPDGLYLLSVVYPDDIFIK